MRDTVLRNTALQEGATGTLHRQTRAEPGLRSRIVNPDNLNLAALGN